MIVLGLIALACLVLPYALPWSYDAIDWDHVYETAELVVDTVDSSRGHATKPRQVLRLGAGWS